MCEKTLIFNLCEVPLFVKKTLEEEQDDPRDPLFPLKHSSGRHVKEIHRKEKKGCKMSKPEMVHRQRGESNALSENVRQL